MPSRSESLSYETNADPQTHLQETEDPQSHQQKKKHMLNKRCLNWYPFPRHKLYKTISSFIQENVSQDSAGIIYKTKTAIQPSRLVFK